MIKWAKVIGTFLGSLIGLYVVYYIMEEKRISVLLFTAFILILLNIYEYRKVFKKKNSD
tara:strand:+ start:140 stop:316 length:177 start_codon:yes stop_codon:yes gene_type:complete